VAHACVRDPLCFRLHSSIVSFPSFGLIDALEWTLFCPKDFNRFHDLTKLLLSWLTCTAGQDEMSGVCMHHASYIMHQIWLKVRGCGMYQRANLEL